MKIPTSWRIFSNQRLSDFGFSGRPKKSGPLREALTRIQRNGNATKHHEIAAAFDGRQFIKRPRDNHAAVDKSRENPLRQRNSWPVGERICYFSPMKSREKGLTAMPLATSPLRYPGGKTCLLGPISRILRGNKLERGHYAEPYAGGCGLALALLYSGFVSDIHVNDIDPSIWAFWDCGAQPHGRIYPTDGKDPGHYEGVEAPASNHSVRGFVRRNDARLCRVLPHWDKSIWHNQERWCNRRSEDKRETIRLTAGSTKKNWRDE